MGLYLPVLLGFIFLIVAAGIYFIYFDRRKDDKSGKRKKIRQRNRNSIIRAANRKLAINPKDPDALLSLANLHYSEEDFKQAQKRFSTLIDLCASYPDILNEFEITLKFALSSLKMKSYDDAYKAFMIAKSLKADNFEVNYNLGVLEYQKGNFDRATVLLQTAKKIQPEHVQTTRFLGHSLFHIKKYSDAIAALKSAIEYEPDDKESLFFLAQSYYKVGSNDNALKIFMHMRTDPQLGPHAALFGGSIHLNNRNHTRAIMDFEIGLRHESIKPDIEMELKYRLASAYVHEQDIERALSLLRQVSDINPDYKDVQELLVKYQELATNNTLKTYLISPISEFVSLCRKISSNFYPEARAKLVDISIIKNEYIDILAEVSSKRWEDLVLFRFIRSTGTVGELVLRELYARCKELRAGRGFCFSAGDFSDGAKIFVEARLIDLIEKKELMKLFERISKAKSQTAQKVSGF